MQQSRKVLTTFAFGSHREFLSVTLEPMRLLAEAFGYDLHVQTQPDFLVSRFTGARTAKEKMAVSRPFSWLKLPLFDYLFSNCGYDKILWIDADIFLTPASRTFPSVDPAHGLGEYCWQSLVFHQVPQGNVPNCGLWALSREMFPVLHEMWGMVDLVDHPWWEQAALCRLLGFDLDDMKASPRETDLLSKTVTLPWHWNVHPHELRDVPSKPKGLHATQYADRLETLQKWESLYSGKA